MRRVTVDASEAQSFEATEPGPYNMTVAEIDDPAKSKGGTGPIGTMVHFTFDDPKIAQKCGRVSRWYALEGKGAGFFREFWKAATHEDIPVGTTIDVDLDDAIGRKVIVQVENEAYEGRMQNKAARITANA